MISHLDVVGVSDHSLVVELKVVSHLVVVRVIG